MTGRPEYTEIEHTADVGMTFRAPDIRSAFAGAAAAAFDMMCDLDSVASGASFEIRVEGRPDDLEHLMVRWLSELLYLYSSEGVLLSEFDILELKGVGASEGVGSLLTARVRGERFDATRHQMKTELKAPTYHQISVERPDDEWSVRVIFDT